MKKFKSTERFLKPDPVHKSRLAGKFINCMMWEGKKALSERIFYDALKEIEGKIKDKPPIEVFEAAVENVKPLIEVRSKRVGGATYQVPMEVGKKRQLSLAIRWILDSARGKKGKPMYVKLAAELADAYKKEGAAITVRENIHRMAEANKAFAHFAW
ncbi:MAG: 30S ribosomal protein S7 [Planctomycetota bacterium]